jgi:hypothetical protein
VKAELDTAIRRAVRRGIAENSGGVLTLLVKDIDGYDRDHLKAQVLAAIRAVGGTCSRQMHPCCWPAPWALRVRAEYHGNGRDDFA